MDNQLFILLYSKYSLHSKKLLEIAQQLPINIQPICVDNTNTRKIILESKKIKIKSVPTILIVYPTGGVEQYDGESAFNWVVNILEKTKPVVQEKPKIEEPVEKPKQRVEKKKDNKKQKSVRFSSKKTDISKLIDEDTIINENKDDEEEENSNNEEDNIIYDDIIDISEKPKTEIKQNTNASSILAAAMEMQKMREQETDIEKRPSMPIRR
jgi:hypothetical protein